MVRNIAGELCNVLQQNKTKFSIWNNLHPRKDQT